MRKILFFLALVFALSVALPVTKADAGHSYSTWNSGVITFKDDRYSPADGKTLWEFAPDLAATDPGTFIVLKDEFTTYDTTNTWAYAGTGTSSAALQYLAGGVLQLSGSGSAGIAQIQAGSGFSILATSKPAWFEAYVSTNDAANSVIVVGLVGSGAGTTNVLNTPPTSGVWFSKAGSGNSSVSFKVGSGSVTTVTGVATMTNNTYLKLGFYWDGAGNAYPYVNGVAGSAVTTNIPSSGGSVLTPSFAVGGYASQNTSKTLNLDWYKFLQVR